MSAKTCDVVVGMYLCGNKATHRIASVGGWRYVCGWHEHSALRPAGYVEPLAAANPQEDETDAR